MTKTYPGCPEHPIASATCPACFHVRQERERAEARAERNAARAARRAAAARLIPIDPMQEAQDALDDAQLVVERLSTELQEARDARDAAASRLGLLRNRLLSSLPGAHQA